MESSQKQRIVDKVKKATNILVTVSRNPSVDELSAALSLTLMLNKMDKHATAVFSGAVPPAITFLEPQKTFEQDTTSLRDFIVALDKEKADRLRYKVEDDVVRIYITPYRTTITEHDLKFSQGDFNVEMIIALGVKDKTDLDQAIAAHGRILHDATIITINTDESKGSLGSIEWSDKKASSLCEMLMNLSESLKSNLLDEQISTALLTGIVAATDRFSNQQTSPRAMTMSAQLMAAGANQQLIADELEQADAINQPPSSEPVEQVASDGRLREGASAKIDRSDTPPVTPDSLPEPAPTPTPQPSTEETTSEESIDDGSLHIEHEGVMREPTPQQQAQDALDAALASNAPPKAPTISVADLQRDIAAESDLLEKESSQTISQDTQSAPEAPVASPEPAPITPPVEVPPTPPVIEPAAAPIAPPPAPSGSDWRDMPTQEPTYGSPLNATTEEAAEARRLAEARDRNRRLLSHDSPSATATPGSESVNGQTQAEQTPVNTDGDYVSGNDSYAGLSRGKDIQPVTMQPISADPSAINQALSEFQQPVEPGPAPAAPTIAELEAQAHLSAQTTDERASSLEAARSEIDSLFGSASGYEVTPLPGQEAASPVAVPPEFSEPAPNVAPQPAPTAATQMPPMPPMPGAMPDFTTLPPLPNEVQSPAVPHPGMNPFDQPAAPQPAQTPPVTPGQFQIPGQ